MFRISTAFLKRSHLPEPETGHKTVFGMGQISSAPLFIYDSTYFCKLDLKFLYSRVSNKLLSEHSRKQIWVTKIQKHECV